jgi:hypothetical protein
VVDDQIDRDRRVDARRVASGAGDGAAHRGEVDRGRHAGEILHQDSERHERDAPPGAR